MRLLRSAVPIVSVAAILACGGGGGDDGPASPNAPNTPGTPTNPVTSATVAMTSGDDGYGSQTNKFNPADVRLVRGGSVTWTNDTGISHNVTFSGAGAPQHIGNHTSGSNSRTFAATGAISFECTNHAGMTGTVTVQ